MNEEILKIIMRRMRKINIYELYTNVPHVYNVILAYPFYTLSTALLEGKKSETFMLVFKIWQYNGLHYRDIIKKPVYHPKLQKCNHNSELMYISILLY